MIGRAPGWMRIAAVGLLLLAAAAGWSLTARGGADPATATVHREDLAVTVEAAGELDAVRSSLIGPPYIPNTWEFKISFLVPESASVRKGERILAFDTTALESDLQKRRTEYEVALKDIEKLDADQAIRIGDLELQLDEAASRLGKSALKAESPEDLAGTMEIRLARLDHELAVKETESLRVRIEATRRSGEADREGLVAKRDYAAQKIREIEESIRRMSIAAPQDGIVIYQPDWNGEKRKLGDSVWAAAKVLKIPDLSEMLGNADVDEAEAGRLAPGQAVTIHLDALPDAEYPGRLRSIGQVVQLAGRGSTLKVYKVEFSLDRTDPGRMRPGMRLRAAIEVDRRAGALVAPREAIFLRAEGPIVFVRSGGGFEAKRVRLGLRNERIVEILEGASEGDAVALEDPTLAAGSRRAGESTGGPAS